MKIGPLDDRGRREVKITDVPNDMSITFSVREIEWPPEIMEALTRCSPGWTP